MHKFLKFGNHTNPAKLPTLLLGLGLGIIFTVLLLWATWIPLWLIILLALGFIVVGANFSMPIPGSVEAYNEHQN